MLPADLTQTPVLHVRLIDSLIVGPALSAMPTVLLVRPLLILAVPAEMALILRLMTAHVPLVIRPAKPARTLLLNVQAVILALHLSIERAETVIPLVRFVFLIFQGVAVVPTVKIL